MTVMSGSLRIRFSRGAGSFELLRRDAEPGSAFIG